MLHLDDKGFNLCGVPGLCTTRVDSVTCSDCLDLVFDYNQGPTSVKYSVDQIEEAGGYSVIYADPPWRYRETKVNGAAAKHYPTMSLREICALPVKRLAAKDSVLFMWGTYPMLLEAIVVLESWGFEYKTIAFQWLKTCSTGIIKSGQGQWTRSNTEPCWLGVRGHPHHMVLSHRVSQIIETLEDSVIVSPRYSHSTKPPIVRDRIVDLIGDVPRLELFARQNTSGWDAWGNQVNSDIIL